MFQTEIAEKNKPHVFSSATFFSENRAVYEIIWKDIAGRDRPHVYTAHAHWMLDTLGYKYTHPQLV